MRTGGAPGENTGVHRKDSRRTQDYEHVQLDFLGYTFRPRRVVDVQGRFRTGFTPAVGAQAQKVMRQSLRERRLASRSDRSLEDIAGWMAPRVRGWMAY